MSTASEKKNPPHPSPTSEAKHSDAEESSQTLNQEGFIALEVGFGTGINEKVMLVTKGMTLKKIYELSKESV